MFTTQISLALLLIIDGDVPLLSQYVYMTCIGNKLYILLEIKANELPNRQQVTLTFTLLVLDSFAFSKCGCNVFLFLCGIEKSVRIDIRSF